MPDVGRWGAVDPLASKYYRLSPMVYAANNPVVLIDPNGRELDYSKLGKPERKEFRALFKELRRSSETGKAVAKFLKSKKSGRIVLRAGPKTSGYASFTSNWQISSPETDTEGNETGRTKYDRTHPETEPDFSNASETGGALNVDFQGLKDSREPSAFDSFVEEAAHAALFGTAAKENGSNIDVDLPKGNDEFSAKAIVGQIEKEYRPITNYSNDAIARAFGVQAFANKSAVGFYPAALKWRSEQSFPYSIGRSQKQSQVSFFN